MTKIEKLDGFTADGAGKVVGGASDLVDGDVMRVDDRIEQRYRAPAPVEDAPTPAPRPTDIEIILARLDTLDEKLSALAAG